MVWLLIGYVFLFIHRPFEVWPVLSDLHVERIYVGFMLLAALAWPGKGLSGNRLHWALAAFGLAVFISWVASPWMRQGEQTAETYFKILVFYPLVILCVHSERDLKRLVAGFLVVMALYMTHSLREYVAGRHVYRMGIVRMIGVDAFQCDPNSFGASVLYALPFVAAFWRPGASLRVRQLLIGYTALSVLCIGLTGSRSAFVGLVLWGLLVAVRSRGRLALILGALVVAPVLWSLLPGDLQNRFGTIVDPTKGPANARTSAQGRIQGLFTGLRLWYENPATGVGPGAWRPATGSDIESHNLYGQLVGETGTLGAVTFLAVLAAFWRDLRWVRRAYAARPYWRPDFLLTLSESIGVTVLLLLFEGNFSHNLYRNTWVWYAAFLTVAVECVRRRMVQDVQLSPYWDSVGEAAAGAAGPALAYGRR